MGRTKTEDKQKAATEVQTEITGDQKYAIELVHKLERIVMTYRNALFDAKAEKGYDISQYEPELWRNARKTMTALMVSIKYGGKGNDAEG